METFLHLMPNQLCKMLISLLLDFNMIKNFAGIIENGVLIATGQLIRHGQEIHPLTHVTIAVPDVVRDGESSYKQEKYNLLSYHLNKL